MRMPGAGQRRRPRPIRLRVWGADSLQRPDSLGQHPDGLAATAGPEEGRTEPGLHPGDAADSLASTGGADSLAAGSGSDSRTHGSPRADSLRMADSLSVPGSLPDSLDRAADTLTVAQRKALLKGSGAQGQGRKEGRGSQNQEGAARFDSRQTQGEDHGQTAVAEGARGGASGRPAAEGCVEAQKPGRRVPPARER